MSSPPDPSLTIRPYRAGNGGVIAFYRRLGYQIDDGVNLAKRLHT